MANIIKQEIEMETALKNRIKPKINIKRTLHNRKIKLSLYLMEQDKRMRLQLLNSQ